MFDFVSVNVGCGVEEDDSIGVVDDSVPDDPCKATFNHEDSLSAALADRVVKDHCVGAGGPSESQVSLVVLRDGVLLDVRISRLNQENSLAEVEHDGVVHD